MKIIEKLVCHDEIEAKRIQASLYGNYHIESKILVDDKLGRWTVCIEREEEDAGVR